MPKAYSGPLPSSLVAGSGAAILLLWLAVAPPLHAQQEAPRPSPREGPDTTCGPSYGSRPFGDSAAANRPGCPRVGEPAVKAPQPAPPASVPVAPLSPKTDSLRQQADSASRRPTLP